MPGEEAVGLAMGAIALAALFNTCIELFDYFELGRNYIYDYELACTKIELLRERLRAWGGALRVMEPGAEDLMLRALWPTTCDAVGKSLLAIRAILRSSDILMQKYELRPDNSSKWSLNLRRRSKWAIHDKTKFDMLIRDLAFLIENLERVARRIFDEKRALGSLTTYTHGDERNFWKRELPFLDPPEPLPSSDNYYYQQYEEAKEGHYDSKSQQIPRSGRQHLICGTQRNFDSSIGVQGMVGNTGDTYWISGVQINSQRALGIQGAVSPEALAYLQDSGIARKSY